MDEASINQLIASAVAAEREACALACELQAAADRLAQGHQPNLAHAAAALEQMATSIRSRAQMSDGLPHTDPHVMNID